MKNLRVISLTVVMALSTLVAAHGNRTQETQRVGAVVGYLVGGDTQSTLIGAGVGVVVGAGVGAVAGSVFGGVGALPGAVAGGAAGGL